MRGSDEVADDCESRDVNPKGGRDDSRPHSDNFGLVCKLRLASHRLRPTVPRSVRFPPLGCGSLLVWNQVQADVLAALRGRLVEDRRELTRMTA